MSVPIPRKSASSGAAQHDKGLQKFYSALYDSFVRHIPYANAGLRAIVIASPGWVKDAVYDYIFMEAVKRGEKALQRALKEKCVKVHVNSPHVHSLVEVLKSPEVSSRLKETKFASEGMVLDRFVLSLSFGRGLLLFSLASLRCWVLTR
jgi:protein pelota